MKKKLIFFCVLQSFGLIPISYAQPPIEWTRVYGGSWDDAPNSVQQTFDGGYIMGGYTESNDSDVTGNHGDWDAWVVKTDSVGNLQWQKCLGGSDYDEGISVKQIRDGGFIVLVKIRSNDGDITIFNGYEDYWIVKLDSAGTLIWQRSFGGSNFDIPTAIEQTFDNGFIAAGYTTSNDSDVSGNHGGEDYWLIKLDSVGNLQWQKCLGGSRDDEAYDVCQTNDSGYVAVGHSFSTDDDVANLDSAGCSWMVKINSLGAIVWQKTFSSLDTTYDIRAVLENSNKEVIFAGSKSYYVTVNWGYLWMGKLDSLGNTIWTKQYLAGGQWHYCRDAMQTIDGGYILSARQEGNGSPNPIIYKIDGSGNAEWYKAFNIQFKFAYGKQTSDAGYIIATEWPGGTKSFWLTKLVGNSTIITGNSLSSLNLRAFISIASKLVLEFSISIPANLQLVLRDISGRTLLYQSIQTNSGIIKKEIPIGDLAKGIYIVTLSGDEGSASVKVSKE